jgi:L-ascorbate metabolism protein UlaG (beta-lactamase superfamily)
MASSEAAADSSYHHAGGVTRTDIRQNTEYVIKLFWALRRPFNKHLVSSGEESMMRICGVACFFTILLTSTAGAEMKFEKDKIGAKSGDIEVTFIGHATLMFSYAGKVIHVDPWSSLADYSKMPKADIVLITHEHRDHLDPQAVKLIRTEKTAVVLPEKCASQIEDGVIMKNGDVKTIEGIRIEAVSAYNIVNMRSEGVPYHPRGEGNGYIITLGDKRIYIAGDTENTPEMKALKDIDIAFLPMNLPYTMTPEMVADAAKAFKPKILYPYHFGNTDPMELVALLKDEPEIEVRIRQMK